VFFADKLHLNYAAYQAARSSYYEVSQQEVAQQQDNSWKNVMPNADMVPMQDKNKFWLTSGQAAGLRVGIGMLELEYQSPVLTPFLFKNSPILNDNKLKLQTVGFTPIME
jgi:hypothetical protein